MFVLASIPFISAAIGWFTNWVAIKMLFHPREEKDYYLFKLHGIFPKRKHVLAERLGKVVARDLFNIEQVKVKIDNEENREKVKTAILVQIEDYLVNKFKPSNPMLGMFLSDKVLEQINGKMAEMLDELIPKIIGQMVKKVEEIDVEKNVYNKVSNFSSEKLEALLMSVIEKELQFVEIVGGVLGFVIGVLQIGLMWASGQIQI
jgi:uncharacterized membrane protein YheB (UPF0754 family)